MEFLCFNILYKKSLFKSKIAYLGLVGKKKSKKILCIYQNATETKQM